MSEQFQLISVIRKHHTHKSQLCFCVPEAFILFDIWDIWSYYDEEKELFILFDMHPASPPLSWLGRSCDRKKVAHLKIWWHVEAEQRHDGEHGECQSPTTSVTVLVTIPYYPTLTYHTIQYHTLQPYSTIPPFLCDHHINLRSSLSALFSRHCHRCPSLQQKPLTNVPSYFTRNESPSRGVDKCSTPGYKVIQGRSMPCGRTIGRGLCQY